MVAHLSPKFFFSICWQSIGNFIFLKHILISFFFGNVDKQKSLNYHHRMKTLTLASVCFLLKQPFCASDCN